MFWSVGSGGEEGASTTTDPATDVRCLLWNAAAKRVTQGVQHLVEFAKRLPGFNNLPQDDQLILIKVSHSNQGSVNKSSCFRRSRV